MTHVPSRTAPAESALIAARILLEIKAVLFRPDEPFIFTSGRASPVYVDCRRIISFPRARRRLMDMGVDLVERAVGHESVDAIAGGETAGIPFAAWMAERMALPMLYVRKKAKGFGRNAQIEGTFEPGARVLLVEDLATDGGSKLNFVRALRAAEAKVTDTFVIFHYGIFPQSTASLAAEGVRLHALVTWWDMLAVAEADKLMPPAQVESVRSFLTAPDPWSLAHGGKVPAEAAEA